MLKAVPISAAISRHTGVAWSFNKNHTSDVGRCLSCCRQPLTVSAAAAWPVCSIWYTRQNNSASARPHLGVRSTSHKWVNSYLNGHCQYVRVSDHILSSVSCRIWNPTRQCAWAFVVHHLHFTDHQRHHTFQSRSLCPTTLNSVSHSAPTRPSVLSTTISSQWTVGWTLTGSAWILTKLRSGLFGWTLGEHSG